MLSIPVSPVPPPMSRRVPLSNIQNQALSPYSLNATIPAKRPAKPCRDILGPPPAKKTHLDDGYHTHHGLDQKENRLTTPSKIRLVPKTPSRHDAGHSRRDAPPSRAARVKVPAPSRRPFDNQPKNKRPVQRTAKEKHAAAVAENNQQIRAWQRHYLKLFPHLIFYLDDSVPEDTRAVLRINLHDLHAAVVDQFSASKVTHVITSRDDIPPELAHERAVSGASTINPKLLASGANLKGTSKEAGLRKLNVFDDTQDILVAARFHNLKIWPADKLKRMINTLNEKIEDEVPPPAKKLLPSKFKLIDLPGPLAAPTGEQLRLEEEEELDRLLNQDTHRTSQPSVSKEMYMFKGPYVMVGDASGRYRPFIVREFTSVKEPENGDWPQFRSNREGRCPFILDPDTKRAYHREATDKAAEAKAKQKEREALRVKSRTTMEPPVRENSLKAKVKSESTVRAAPDRRTLGSIENKVGRDMATAAAATAIRKTEGRTDKLREAQRARQDSLVITGYEPNASGLRATGPTSAVVSQAISSNTAAVGVKAGTSRDVHRLNRRVFEKTTGGIRQTNAVTPLQAVDEDNRNETKAERTSLKRSRSEMVAKEVKKQPVAGYCENCRDKYDDFEEHIVSKRHLKFASNDSNFRDLDALLDTLKRHRKLSRTPSY